MEHGTFTFFIFKWIHFLAGITWIGVLYYFNFIQGEWFKEIEDQTKGKAVITLVPRALWWFRWGAMFTFLSGIIMLGMKYHGGATPSILQSYDLYIFIGALLGTLMFLNVWVIIWPAQKVVIASSESVASGGEADPRAAASLASAGLASRTNTLFSIPMLFFMGAARNLFSLTPPPPDAPPAGLTPEALETWRVAAAEAAHSAALVLQHNQHIAIWIIVAVILLLEANSLFGKMGPMKSVAGVIHCGLLLTFILILPIYYLCGFISFV